MLIEEIRPAIIDDMEIPGYFVSNFGKIYSTLIQKPIRINNKFCGAETVIGTVRKEKKLSVHKNPDGSIADVYVNLYCPKGIFDYDYVITHSKNSQSRKIYVHQLVMNAFRPIKEYPPDRIKDCWKDTPKEVKRWIAETAIINHIDHNPANNRLDNLEYVTPRENSRKAIVYYGGNNEGKKLKLMDIKKEIQPDIMAFFE